MSEMSVLLFPTVVSTFDDPLVYAYQPTAAINFYSQCGVALLVCDLFFLLILP